jgi:ribonuclease P protein component
LLARLATADEFKQVLDHSRTLRSPHFALHVAKTEALPQRSERCTFGVIVPKRWAKRAVTRNTLKRQAYAVTHQLASQLRDGHYVLRLRAGFARDAFVSATSPALKRAVRGELLALFAQVCTRPAAQELA